MNRKYLYLLALILMQCSSGTKLTDLYQKYNQEDYLYWAENRKLRWEDFQGRVTGNTRSNISVIIPAMVANKNLFSRTSITVICALNKRESWISPESRSETMLLYNQVIFNIYELYARKLRQKSGTTDFGLDEHSETFDKLVSENKKDLLERVMSFRGVCKDGKERKVIEEWNNSVNKELDDLNSYKIIYDGKEIHTI